MIKLLCSDCGKKVKGDILYCCFICNILFCKKCYDKDKKRENDTNCLRAWSYEDYVNKKVVESL